MCQNPNRLEVDADEIIGSGFYFGMILTSTTP
jgi:hypothetical protein